jgi:hypothetical protein
MSRFHYLMSIMCLCAVSLALVSLTGCQSKGASQSSGDSQPAGSSENDGPTQEEIQRELIAGLPTYITQHCAADKANMLNSVKSIRYIVKRQALLNTLDGGHKVIRIEGTLYWSYESKEIGTNSSAGNLQNFVMTNDPSSTPDHQERWEFLGVGPWSDIVGDLKNCSRIIM